MFEQGAVKRGEEAPLSWPSALCVGAERGQGPVAVQQACERGLLSVGELALVGPHVDDVPGEDGALYPIFVGLRKLPVDGNKMAGMWAWVGAEVRRRCRLPGVGWRDTCGQCRLRVTTGMTPAPSALSTRRYQGRCFIITTPPSGHSKRLGRPA